MAQKTGKTIMGPTLPTADADRSGREDFGSTYGGGRGSGVTFGGFGTPVGTVYGARGIPLGGGTTASVGGSPRGGGRFGGSLSIPFKKGGKVKKMAKGGSTASKRADGCATKGKTKGRFV